MICAASLLCLGASWPATKRASQTDHPKVLATLSDVTTHSVLPPWSRLALERRSVHPIPAVVIREDIPRLPSDGILYASDYGNNVVECYSTQGFDPAPFGSISGLTGPQGVATEGKRVTVANTFSSNILVYQNCAPQPIRTMIDPTGYPVGVAIDQNGNTYVTNIRDFNGGGEIREYSPKGRVGVQLGDPNLLEDYFVAVDSAGDVFVDGLTASAAEVDWRPAGSTQWKNTNIPLTFPGGLGINDQGDLVVDDQGGKYTISQITAYSVPGFKQSAPSFICPAGNCVSFGVDRHTSKVWIAAENNGSPNYIWGVQYAPGIIRDAIFDNLTNALLIDAAATSQ